MKYYSQAIEDVSPGTYNFDTFCSIASQEVRTWAERANGDPSPVTRPVTR
jgi:hypothetical protein